MDRAKEIAAALRKLAIDEDDTDLADALLEAVAKVERFADYKLRTQTQGVLGETHLTLQERIDSLFNVARDTHQLVFSVQQEQGAALTEARDMFSALGERVTDVEGRMDASEKDREAIHKELKLATRERADMAQAIDRVETLLTTLIETRLAPLEELAKDVLPADERKAMTDWLREQMRREASGDEQ